MDELLELEDRGWRALVEGTARAFYRDLMLPETQVVVPGMVLDRDQTIASWPEGPAWDEYAISEARTVALTPESMLLVYRARSRRGDFHYDAYVTSGYVRRDGRWRLGFHQQTPVPS